MIFLSFMMDSDLFYEAITNSLAKSLAWVINARSVANSENSYLWGHTENERPNPHDTSQVLLSFFISKLTDSPMIISGMEYLQQEQNKDGGWRHYSSGKKSVTYSTVFCLSALSKYKLKSSKQNLQPAFDFLRTSQNSDGGWGRYVESPSEIRNTALVIMGLIDSGFIDSVQVKNGILFLKNNHGVFGGWPELINGTEDTVSTAEVLLSLKKSNINLDDAIIKNAEKYLLDNFTDEQDHGYWMADSGWDVETTSYAIRSLYYDPSNTNTKINSQIEKSFKWLVKIQHADGGWGNDHSSILDRHLTISQTVEPIQMMAKFLSKTNHLPENIMALDSFKTAFNTKADNSSDKSVDTTYHNDMADDLI